jgi:hypothetical protein
MKKLRKNFSLALILLALGAGVSAAWALAKPVKIDVIVKADGALAKLDTQDIRAIYLGDKTFQGSTRIEPLVNGANTLTELFLQKVLNKTKAQYKNIWTGKAFIDGLSSPPVLPSSSDVLRAVRNNDAAIGFVAEKDLPKGDKEIKVIFTVDTAE